LSRMPGSLWPGPGIFVDLTAAGAPLQGARSRVGRAGGPLLGAVDRAAPRYRSSLRNCLPQLRPGPLRRTPVRGGPARSTPPVLNREGNRPMSLAVQKFGGSSVADADSIKRVAKRIALYSKAGHKVVVVVSAMRDTTDDLIDLAAQVTPNPPLREMDMLITAGERISTAVRSMALNEVGIAARAHPGSHAWLTTDGARCKAQHRDVT